MPIILGIESSCDDTAAAVLVDRHIRSNIVASQDVHREHGGVVPELAARAHLQNIIPVVDQALSKANIDKKEVNAVAYTLGPGLIGSLLVGNSFAKSLAMSLNVPLIEVNHMQAHLLVHFEKSIPNPSFPFIGLTVSGGHTQLVLVKSPNRMEVIGQTLDDAVGEAFDKVGKMIGLPYPAGPYIDKYAQDGEPNISFSIPKVPGLDFSFSGLKTSALNTINSENLDEQIKADIACAFVDAVVDTLTIKCQRAIEETKINQLVVAGGVSANKQLQHALVSMLKKENGEVFFPRNEYCTDNGAMVAYAGYLRIKKGHSEPLSFHAKPRWSIDNI